uniref:Uncharacterized protein n=1 Tax=Oryza glumipatula TaxID=40148 RepID=A0A0E0BBX4_9ORYZ
MILHAKSFSIPGQPKRGEDLQRPSDMTGPHVGLSPHISATAAAALHRVNQLSSASSHRRLRHFAFSHSPPPRRRFIPTSSCASPPPNPPNPAAAAMADDEAAVLPPPPPLPPPCRPHRQLRPRGYQVKVFEAALRGNTIAVLDTGSGKTMVAVMLAREHARRVRAGEAPRRIVVFLAPTVHLVHQQFEVIREYTDLDVMMCSGASRVGEWGADHWKEEVGRNEIVVMTPQILLDALRHAFLTMSAVSLLIFDECHRACGSHPYARIMKEFYFGSQWRPDVFGMTASPIYIVEDRNELESFSPPATIVNKYYDAYMVDFDNLKSKLQILSDEFDALLVGLQESPSNKFKDTDNILETSRKSLSRYHGKILYSLNDLGPIITSEVVKIHIESVKPLCDSEDCIFSKASLCLHMSYFKEALILIEEILPQGYGELMKSESGSEELTKRGYISSKVNTLINIFKSFGSSNEVLCLIFVDRIMTAKAVEREYIKRCSESSSSEIYFGFVPSWKDVTEEGVDVPNCSCVIRFDLPRTVCSYVQSRGRARRNNSEFILMIERGNLQQQEHIFRMIQTGYYVKNCALYRHPNALSYDLSIQGMYTYQVQSTGATITADCCVNLIRKYCEKLPKDRYFMPKPSFEVTIEDGLFKCTLTLPRNAAFQSIVGPLSSSSNLSKQLVSLEACKKLHQLGELNDHLVPLTEEPMDTDFTTADEKCISGPGTTKRKELHEGENYAGFVLLMEPELDDDVAPSKMDLFLIPNKMVYTTVTPRGKVQLNKKQLGKGKLFQEFFFNGIFGRLFHGSRKSGAQRDFIFKKGHEIQWNTESMYLLLPLRDSSYIQDDLSIHWEAIESCAGAVEQLWSSYQGDENVIPVNCIPQKRRGGQEEIIHLANKSLHCSSIKDSVVLSLHTGRIYTVLDLILDTTAEDSFDEMCKGKASPFTSFVDYYHQKYGIIIQHPEQPLLLLKQSHNAHNLLFSKLKYLDGSTGKPLLMEKEQIHARVPPELLIHLDSLMLASQLRREIGYNQHIPVTLILEAITTLRCCETFSLERLELLGDSVLKYVVGCDLFLRYPMKHEGQLSDMRSKAVCNATLHKHGIWRVMYVIMLLTHGVGLLLDRYRCALFLVTVESRLHLFLLIEALVGAYYVGGGIAAALWVMRWFGIDIKCDMKLLQEVKFNASHLCSLSKINDIEELEAKLKYNFSVKGLLLEAITHPSLQELGVDYCYQRLEFLGDSVLDLLLTCHLYATHTDVDPGELTDLRSALVSNENFAQAVVRNNIHSHLQHGSGILLEQITEYVRSNLECQGKESEFLQHTTCKVPKVLGDIMESIAGAVFIDTDFNVDMVWEIFEPLLSPLITPDKLALPPYRELLELCSHIGCFLNSKCTSKGEEVIIEMSLQLRDELLVAQGHDRNKKRAKAKAASRILADLKQQGLSIKQCLSKAKQLDIVTSDLQFDLTSSGTQLSYSDLNDYHILEGLSSVKKEVVLPLKMEKGGPRSALFKLCKILQWPMPEFEFVEQRFRTPIVMDGATTTNFNSFVSTITLHIPDATTITFQGERRTDKKSAQDSASLMMLHKLQELKICICKT